MAGFCIVMLMMGVFLPIFIIFLLCFLTFLIVIIFNYFMESFALYRLCKNSNYNRSFTAWIPFYNRVLLGDFADNKKLGIATFILSLIYLLLFLLFVFFINYIPEEFRNVFSNVIMLIALVIYVLNIILVHLVMKKSIPKWADILTVFNVFTLGISKAIVLFVLRNNDKLIKIDEIVNE